MRIGDDEEPIERIIADQDISVEDPVVPGVHRVIVAGTRVPQELMAAYEQAVGGSKAPAKKTTSRKGNDDGSGE